MAGASLMIATTFGTTTGLTNASALNFRGAGAEWGIALANMGGGGAGGAVGTGASISAIINPRVGSSSTKNMGTRTRPVIRIASPNAATTTVSGRQVLPVGTKVYSNMGHFL